MEAVLRVPEPLATAWSRILSGADLASVRDDLAAKGLIGLSPEAAVEAFRLRFDFANRIAPYAEKLRKIEPLALSIAPVIVGVQGNPRDAAILVRFPAVSGEELAPPPALPQLDPEAAGAIRRDLHALWDAGLDHGAALRGPSTWRRGQRTGRWVLEGWEALVPLDPAARAAREERLEEVLALWSGR
jgi:hypothetical protein